jgi:hypothetical protein
MSHERLITCQYIVRGNSHSQLKLYSLDTGGGASLACTSSDWSDGQTCYNHKLRNVIKCMNYKLELNRRTILLAPLALATLLIFLIFLPLSRLSFFSFLFLSTLGIKDNVTHVIAVVGRLILHRAASALHKLVLPALDTGGVNALSLEIFFIVQKASRYHYTAALTFPAFPFPAFTFPRLTFPSLPGSITRDLQICAVHVRGLKHHRGRRRNRR